MCSNIDPSLQVRAWNMMSLILHYPLERGGGTAISIFLACKSLAKIQIQNDVLETWVVKWGGASSILLAGESLERERNTRCRWGSKWER